MNSVLLSLSASLAHPGHGITAPTSWRHFLTEPLHVASLAIPALILSALVLRRLMRRRSGS